MGFLDNSTNNIIMDAVLTDRGRQYLARNDGSFSILNFALADDEVDYTIIKKYGMTVGKEKIIKNTPVFEAQTHENLAVKYKLLSLSNAKLIRMPNMVATLPNNASFVSLTIASDVTSNQQQLTVSQNITNQTVVPNELVDSLFLIEMDNRFLTIPGAVANINSDGTASYLLNGDTTNTSQGGGKISFTLKTVSIPQFTLFATYSNSAIIKTYVTVTGWFSGAQKIFEVQIQDTTQ